MKDFLENNIHKILGSAGLLGLIQFLGQLRDYMADGQLDTHEIEQLFLSSSSAAQTIIIAVIVIYLKFFKTK